MILIFSLTVVVAILAGLGYTICPPPEEGSNTYLSYIEESVKHIFCNRKILGKDAFHTRLTIRTDWVSVRSTPLSESDVKFRRKALKLLGSIDGCVAIDDGYVLMTCCHPPPDPTPYLVAVAKLDGFVYGFYPDHIDPVLVFYYATHCDNPGVPGPPVPHQVEKPGHQLRPDHYNGVIGAPDSNYFVRVKPFGAIMYNVHCGSARALVYKHGRQRTSNWPVVTHMLEFSSDLSSEITKTTVASEPSQAGDQLPPEDDEATPVQRLRGGCGDHNDLMYVEYGIGPHGDIVQLRGPIPFHQEVHRAHTLTQAPLLIDNNREGACCAPLVPPRDVPLQVKQKPELRVITLGLPSRSASPTLINGGDARWKRPWFEWPRTSLVSRYWQLNEFERRTHLFSIYSAYRHESVEVGATGHASASLTKYSCDQPSLSADIWFEWLDLPVEFDRLYFTPFICLPIGRPDLRKKFVVRFPANPPKWVDLMVGTIFKNPICTRVANDEHWFLVNNL